MRLLLAALLLTACASSYQVMDPPLWTEARLFISNGVLHVQAVGTQEGWPVEFKFRADVAHEECLVQAQMPWAPPGSQLLPCDPDLGLLVRDGGPLAPDGVRVRDLRGAIGPGGGEQAPRLRDRDEVGALPRPGGRGPVAVRSALSGAAEVSEMPAALAGLRGEL